MKARGFTFVELMMTLAILGVLALVALPLAEYSIRREKERELRNALIEIRTAIDTYKGAAEQGRINVPPGDSGYPRALGELVEGVVDQRSPVRQKLYFLRRLPADPFAAPGVDASLTWGLRAYASPPDMPVPGRDVFDIYSLSPLAGLNGVPYRQW
ncbi:type II secretion system protein [Rhodocyclus tenuis]|uniref:General secretion pathway protein G n=1 Tax=Rhodocyclus tenuis TaxID=1066 RepID=A0A840GE67_RHOTE|nr:type II secretion system protein [Rhodocyclus tenuis]MBB4249140.1 general secretion pathway protein G [Rhodocyclus tenuis]